MSVLPPIQSKYYFEETFNSTKDLLMDSSRLFGNISMVTKKGSGRGEVFLVVGTE